MPEFSCVFTLSISCLSTLQRDEGRIGIYQKSRDAVGVQKLARIPRLRHLQAAYLIPNDQNQPDYPEKDWHRFPPGSRQILWLKILMHLITVAPRAD